YHASQLIPMDTIGIFALFCGHASFLQGTNARLFPDPNVVREWAPVLKKYQLNVFTGNYTAGGG
ncbi:MAG: hypothetical protein ACYDEZ_09070, partial [Methanoregula sp.]